MPVFVSPEECGGFRKALAGIMKENEVLSFIFLPTENACDVGNSGKPITSKARYLTKIHHIQARIFIQN
jgi:hypothetical protein